MTTIENKIKQRLAVASTNLVHLRNLSTLLTNAIAEVTHFCGSKEFRDDADKLAFLESELDRYRRLLRDALALPTTIKVT